MTPKKPAQGKRPVETYEHRDKARLNNPPVGLVTPDTDPDTRQKAKSYAYDPHLDPQLVWAGKVEHISFQVPTVSLHVHERIDPRTIIEAVRKRNDDGQKQLSFFEMLEENLPLRQAIEFYQHAYGWSNRLVAGDSLLVMNSLMEKEGMAGKVQMIYIDPPYGIKYGSNFQPFVNKRDVKDGRDEDLTQEPEQIRAFRDTWELGIHSYLTYLRDRLLLARELLTESGSVFVQIGDENVHRVRCLMDEVFGTDEFVAIIVFIKASAQTSRLLSSVSDYILWYAKDVQQVKFHQLYALKELGGEGASKYDQVELSDGTRRRLRPSEVVDTKPLLEGARPFRLDNLTSQSGGETISFPIKLNGRTFLPGKGFWKTNAEGMQRLVSAGRVTTTGKTLAYVRYLADFSAYPLTNTWEDIGGIQSRRDPKVYVVQTATEAVKRCLLMTTDPGDLVFDPTCSSGTTAFVAEQWGRRWITCDTSRVALTLAKQRLITALFDYYELAYPQEGVGSGFKYKTVPHVTLKSIANNPDIRAGMPRSQIDAAIARHAPRETLYDQPFVDRKRTRVSGSFTVEAVPAPTVAPLEQFLVSSFQFLESEAASAAVNSKLKTENFADSSVARSGETLRQGEWRDELLRTGIRAKAGQHIRFARLEPLPGCRFLHADGETRPSDEGADRVREEGTAYSPQRIVVSFGPEHAPLEQRQVAQATQEAHTLVPRPKLIVFAAFQFDPEAARDIDEINWPGMTLLKAQMNADLLTDDLKKRRASNESFWLIGQPDVVVDSAQWIVNSRKEALAPYDVVAKLSRTHSLAEINGLGREDLSLFIAIAQRRDLWTAVATDQSGGVDSDKHRGRAGTTRDRGVPELSGHRAGFPGRIGDARDAVRELEILSEGDRRQLIERLRGNREIADRARQIAASLTGSLSTIHYSQVTIHGFDYYNTKTGGVESGGEDKIAVWMLDTDYDGRSLYPRQVFFPMAGEKEGFARLAKNLKAEIDEERIEAYRGTVSLPFEPGGYRRIAVKIVDDRGIESLKVLEVE